MGVISEQSLRHLCIFSSVRCTGQDQELKQAAALAAFPSCTPFLFPSAHHHCLSGLCHLERKQPHGFLIGIWTIFPASTFNAHFPMNVPRMLDWKSPYYTSLDILWPGRDSGCECLFLGTGIKMRRNGEDNCYLLLLRVLNSHLWLIK